jgi:hypothetical protein
VEGGDAVSLRPIALSTAVDGALATLLRAALLVAAAGLPVGCGPDPFGTGETSAGKEARGVGCLGGPSGLGHPQGASTQGQASEASYVLSTGEGASSSGDAVIQIVRGRFLGARLALRGGEVVLIPPRAGIPILEPSGRIHPVLAAFLDGLGWSRREIDELRLRDIPAGVVEVELTVEEDVPEAAAEAFRRVLASRGTTVVQTAIPSVR